MRRARPDEGTMKPDVPYSDKRDWREGDPEKVADMLWSWAEAAYRRSLMDPTIFVVATVVLRDYISALAGAKNVMADLLYHAEHHERRDCCEHVLVAARRTLASKFPVRPDVGLSVTQRLKGIADEVAAERNTPNRTEAGQPK